MGIKDMWFGLIGKTAEERKQQMKGTKSLQQQLAELQAEKEALAARAAKLEAKNEELKQTHIKGAKNAFQGGIRLGREKMRSELTEEGWKERTGFKDLPKQGQMSAFLTHLQNDRILSQEEDKALKTLQDLMRSESVDVMRPKNSWSRYCLLEEFLQGFNGKKMLGPSLDFYRKVFKVILNAKGKNGPKADITSHLPNRRNPLIGYFGAIPVLHTLLETAISSASFDMDKFDSERFWGVFRSKYRDQPKEVEKLLVLHGYLGKIHFSGTQQEILDELKTEGKLKDKPAKKEISKTIQAIHQMSVREMRKALEQQAQMGNVTIAELTPAAKKRTTRKAVGKGGRG